MRHALEGRTCAARIREAVTPERDLAKLLANAQPVLNDGEWVFCESEVAEALMTFREAEGITSLVERRRADELRLPYSLVNAWITMNVYSDLASVGFLAAISNALADAGISCNVVSAFHHDHLFVPYDRRHDALRILQQLRR